MSVNARRPASAGLVKLLILAGLPLVLTLGPPRGIHRADATTPTTTQVSVTSAGGDKVTDIRLRDATPDGRYVLMIGGGGSDYCSCPSGYYELYVRDGSDGTWTHVSSTSTGAKGNGINYGGALSDDGRYVTFSSTSSDLVSGDTNAKEDVFVKDRTTGAIARVSVSSSGTQGNGESIKPAISGDGRYVAFESNATNFLTSDANGTYRDIFVHDRVSGTTDVVSLNNSGEQLTNYPAIRPDLSGDGRFVVFDSHGDFSGDADSYEDVFVRDRLAGTTALVSRNDPFSGGGVRGMEARLSADGRFVAYQALVSSKFQVYRYDRRWGVTGAASVTSSGQPGSAHSQYATISADGRAVGFESDAALVTADTNSSKDAYVFDFAGGGIERVSVKADGSQVSTWSFTPTLSRDGRHAFFRSWGVVASPDTSSDDDVFARDRAEQPPLPPEIPAVQTFGGGSANRGLVRWTSRHESDPVDTATGAYVSSVTDAAFPVLGVDFDFTRTYTSADATSGPLGPGWTNNFLTSLTITAAGDVTVRGEGGAVLEYTRRMDGSLQAAPGGLATLSEVSGGYELVYPDRRTLVFDADGRLTEVLDRNGQGLELAYDTGGLLETVSGSGRTATLSHTGGLLTGIALPGDRSVAFGYTGGLLTSVTDLRGGTTTYGYDAAGRLDSVMDQNDHAVVTTTYDSSGRVIEQEDARGEVGTFSYATNGDGTKTTTYTDARAKEWTDVYLANVLLEHVDPLDNTTEYAYDERGNLISVTDPRGNTTWMTYDERGNLLTRTAPSPLSYTESWTYNAADQVVTATNARGKTTTLAYDSNGNLTSETAPGNVVTAHTYNATTGLLESTTDPRDKTTEFASSSAGDLVSVTDPEGGVTTFTYDASGRRTSIVDARGNAVGADPDDYRTTMTYDDADHVVSATDPLANTTTSAYDAVGNLLSVTDAEDRVTTYQYDAGNNLVVVTAADEAETTYAYDPVANLLSRTDANDHTTTWTYDDANRAATMTNGIGSWAYSYDAAGNPTVVDPPGTGSVSRSYDALNRLTGIDYSDSTPDVTFSYDADSNRTAMTDGAGSVAYAHDDLDRVTSITRGSEVFAYDYDAASNVVSRTYPDETEITASFDDASRLASVSDGSATTTFAYDEAGQLVTTDYPSGNGTVETRTYDRAGRITGVEHADATTTIAGVALDLDGVGNPLGVSDAVFGDTTYQYDARHRLTKACYDTTCTGATDWIEYTYDPVGNRLSEGRPAGTTTYTYNAADQLSAQSGLNGSASFSYDDRGNMTASGPDAFAYDLAERMSSATLGSVTTDYTYDGEGTRLSADDGTEVTEYLWDTLQPLPLLALETDGTDVLRRYLYGHALVSMEDAAGTWYAHPDHLGSTIAVTDAAGDVQWEHAYEPYGAERVTNQVEPGAPEAPMRFTGQYLDDTGLYHLRARQYAPALGVFTATDPLSPASDQPFVSAYGYVHGRPTFGVDPSGLICFSCPVKSVVNAVDDAWDATGGKVVNFVAENPGTSAQFGAAAACVVATFGVCAGAIGVATAAKVVQNGSRYGYGSAQFWNTSTTDIVLAFGSITLFGAPLSLAGRHALSRVSLSGIQALAGGFSLAPSVHEQQSHMLRTAAVSK